MKESEAAMWSNHKSNPTVTTRNALIEHYLFMAKFAASSIHNKFNAYFKNKFQIEELISYGVMGLIEAIEKFEVEKQIKFETYASFRVKGTIRDEIRKQNWQPRSPKSEAERKSGKAIKMLNVLFPTVFQEAQYTRTYESEEALHREDIKNVVMKSLSERDADIVERYWFRGEMMKEIARIYGLSESGISIAMTRIIRHLRERFQETEIQYAWCNN